MDDNQSQSDAQLEDSIADVSLLDTPLSASATGEQSDDNSGDTAAQNGADDAAAAQNNQNDATKQDAENGDAKSTEAQETKTDDAQASADQKSENQNGEQQQQPLSREQRDQAARQAWLERQRSRTEVAQQVDQFYGPQTQEQLVQQGMDPADANVEALRQQMAFSQERTRVAELNATMRAEAVEVYSDFPVFRELNADGSKNPDYDPEFAKQVEDGYKQAARVQVDENGLVLSADVPLYDYYQRMYNIYNRGSSRGAQQKQDATAAMQSRVENPGGSSSTNRPAPGSLEEFEEKYGDVVIT